MSKTSSKTVVRIVPNARFNISGIKEFASEESHFFDRSNMRFAGSKIHAPGYRVEFSDGSHGVAFVTTERKGFDHGSARRATLRVIEDWKGSVRNLSEFLQFATVADARAALRDLCKRTDFEIDQHNAHIPAASSCEHSQSAKRKPYQFSEVSSTFGAPMGRHSILPDDRNAPVTLSLERMTLVDGDYDNGGAYWGSGVLFVAHAENVEIVVRIEDRDTGLMSAYQILAMDAVRKYLPNAEFLMPAIDAEVIADHYMMAAAWSSSGGEIDDCGNDEYESLEDFSFSEDSKAVALAHVQEFIAIAGEQTLAALDPEMVGHDLWLSRCRHGVGFEDRGYGDLGKRLGDLARGMGERHIYLGSDGMLHFDTV